MHLVFFWLFFRVRPLVMSFHAQAILECTCFSVALNHVLTNVADGYSSTSCLGCSADTNTLGWGSDLLRCTLLQSSRHSNVLPITCTDYRDARSSLYISPRSRLGC